MKTQLSTQRKQALIRGAGRGYARLRKYLRPPRELKFTRFGWFFLLITLGVGVAAINTDNNLLYLVLGLLLGLIAASGLLSEMALNRVEWDCRYPPDPVAGRPFLYEVRLRNAKRYFPSFALQVEDRAAGKKVIAKTFFFRIAAGELASRPLEGVGSRRGELQLVDVRISTRFPFGLFEKAIVSDNVRTLIILPNDEGVSVESLPVGFEKGYTPAGRAGSGTELFALRPWNDGDGLRLIHWRKSAGGAGLQSKVFEAEQHPQNTLALVPGGEIALEDAIKLAAKWITVMEGRGFHIGLVAGGERHLPDHHPAHRLALLRTLALYQGEAPGPLTGNELVLAFSAASRAGN